MTREVKKTTVSAILAMGPQEMLQKTGTERWDSEVRKQHVFIVLAQTQCTHVQRLSPKNKGA
jgi:hypothetical protein